MPALSPFFHFRDGLGLSAAVGSTPLGGNKILHRVEEVGWVKIPGVPYMQHLPPPSVTETVKTVAELIDDRGEECKDGTSLQHI